jgi:hypothetical protein
MGVVEGAQQTGFIDLDGNLVIPLPNIFSAGRFSSGLAIVITRRWDFPDERPPVVGTPGPFIFMDRTGQNVFDQEFGSATRFRDGLSRVILLNGNAAFIDATGQNPFGHEFREARDFVDGYARVTLLNGTRTYIDLQGNITGRRW